MKKKSGPFDPDFAEPGDYPPPPAPKGPLILIGIALSLGIALAYWLLGSATVIPQPSALIDRPDNAQDADPRAAPAPLLDPDPFTQPAAPR